MTTVTVDRGELRARLRRAGDALPDASIGTVPILWTNAKDASGWTATAILDDIARLGYEGTQLGAGFPGGGSLRAELASRDLRLAEVYVPLPATTAGPIAEAIGVARACLARLHEAGGDVLCVAVDGSRDRDVVAGRAETADTPSLTDDGWDALADLLHRIADEAAALGHPTVFHPHAATYVETLGEFDRLLHVTDPTRVGICLDTGHHLVAGGDPADAVLTLGERIRHVHLKDVDPDVLAGLREGAYEGLEDAVRHGLFTELGAGALDLEGVLAGLAARAYDGWLMVEQDTSPGPPSESAAIGRRVLAASLRRHGSDRRMRSVA